MLCPVASSRFPSGSSATRIGGCRRQRAGEGDALLFAARQLRWVVLQPIFEPDRLQFAGGALERLRNAGEFKRNCDIFQRRHGRDEVK